MRNGRRLTVPALVLALGLCLAGCSSAGSVHGNSSGSGSEAVNPGTAPDSTVSGGSGSSSSGAVARQIVTTGTMVITTAHPIAAAEKAATITTSVGGRVDDRDQNAATSNEPAHATLTLRIPSSHLSDALARLRKLGSVESVVVTTEDVTTKRQDLDARITALQTSITRLLALEAKATTTTDLIALESDIADRQGDLESLTAQQRYLKDQVAMSTITVKLRAPSAATVKPGPPTPGSVFLASLGGFGVFFNWAFLVLVYLLPWLVLGAVIWIAVVVLLRARRRRRAQPPVE